MRHTIKLQGNAEIKNQRIHCRKLPHFQEDTIVKLQQNNRKLYAIYTPVQSSENAQMSSKYLSLNSIEESLTTLVKVQTPSKLRSVQIELSPIDYQVVNNNFGLLERTFLDQVNIVWPGAQIPLFYNQSNFITLIPKVADLHLVDPYAAISFTMAEETPNIDRNKLQQDSLQEEEEFTYKSLILAKLNKNSSVNFGYDYKIYVEPANFNQIKKFYAKKQQSSILCTIDQMLPFTSFPTFEEFLQYRKLQQSLQLPQLKPILVQICSSQDLPSEKEHKEESVVKKIIIPDSSRCDSNEIGFSCSQVCKTALSLPQKLIMTEQTLNSFQIPETLSLEIFLKELQSKKYRISLQIFDLTNNTKQLESQIRNKFSLRLAQTFFQEKEFIFLQNYYPFFIENDIYELIIQKKQQRGTNFEDAKNFLMIKNTFDANSLENIEQTNSEVSKILYENCFVSEEHNTDKFGKWLPMIKLTAEMRISKLEQSQEQIFIKTFQISYEKEIKQSIDFLLKQDSLEFSSVKILFSTYSANGKTFIHKYLKEVKGLNSWFLDCRKLVHQNNRYEEIKDYLGSLVSLCPFKIIFFDNIQVLIPLIEEGDQMRQKQKTLSQVFAIYISKLLQNNGKTGIFTAKSQANINPIIKFDKIIKLKNPNRHLRQSILNSIDIQADKSWRSQFVDKTESFSLGSFNHYLNAKQIPVKKQSKRKNDFDKIVGLQQAKKTIRSVIEKPNKYGFIYDKVKIKVPRGILLYGATGNGKTALGSSVEDEFPMKFFSVKGSDILSKYIGGSEAAVRQVFEKALSVSPSIIFFDEFQSIVPRRNSSGTGVTDRVVNQFLCYLDGVSSTTGVFIIAASSRPDLIDPALLRPGRIDSHVYLDYPNAEERAQLLKMFENSVKLEANEEEFVQSTQNYSYSDLIGLLKELRIKKSSQVLKLNENPRTQDFKQIDKELFEKTVKSYRIGTEIREQKKQKEIYEKFKFGKGPQIKNQKFVQM